AEVANAVQNLAFSLLHAKRYDDALAAFTRAQTLLTANYGVEHWLTANAFYGHGMVLLEQQRYAQAEPLLCRARATLGAALGAEHARTRRVDDALTTLYREWQKP